MDNEKILGKGKGNIDICVLCNINFIVWVDPVCLITHKVFSLDLFSSVADI